MELIIGRGGSGKTAACINDIAGRLQNCPLSGEKLFLLLPEHATFAAEKMLGEKCNGGAYMRAQVLGFRRFARAVLLEAGSANLPRISDVGRQLVLKKILAENKDNLTTITSRVAKRRGFLATLADEIAELKSWCVNEDDLLSVAATDADLTLGGKLRDLALITTEFNKATAGKQTDAEDMMNEAIKRLPLAKSIAAAEFWIDGFVFFNPQEIALVTELIKCAKDVHITLTLNPATRHPDNLRDTGLFSRQWETGKRLANIMKEIGEEFTVRRLDTSPRFAENAALDAVERRLFAFPGAAVIKETDNTAGAGVKIIETANRRAEANVVAAEIVSLCRDEHYRFRDIAVVIREDGYRSVLQNALHEANVPCFFADKRGAGHHPLAELLRSVFLLLRSFNYEPIFRALRTGFFPVERSEIDLLENYVLEFGIRGKKHWFANAPWHWWRITDLTANHREPGEFEKRRQNAADAGRRRIAEVLRPMTEQMAAAKTVRQITTALYDFLLSLNVPQTLEQWTKNAESEGRLDVAALHRQVWDGVIALFDQFVETADEENISREEYADLLDGGLAALSLSLIPPGLDAVTVGDFDQNSLDNIPVLFVMGANEGIMPRRAKEKGIFTDADRLRLREAGIKLPAGSTDVALTEKYLLYRGFTKAKERLFVSYALADAAGDGLMPAKAVKELRRLLPNVEFMSVPLENFVISAEEMTYIDRLKLISGDTATGALATALRRRRDTGEFADFWRDVYNVLQDDESVALRRKAAYAGLFAESPAALLDKRTAADIFTKNKRLKGSVTRFESYRKCPFAHFANFGLKLAERPERRFAALDLGILLHEVLREFGMRLLGEKRSWGDVGEDEAANIVEEILGEIAPRIQNALLVSSAQYRSRLERIKRITLQSIFRLIKLDRASRFHPKLYEQNFAAANLTFTLKDGTHLELTGKIDRVDVSEDGELFLIYDYKSGKVNLDLTEVYYGLQMQLLTYLVAAQNILAAQAGKEALPAGMLYFFLRYPFITAKERIDAAGAEKKREGELKMNGWTINDEAVLNEIDNTKKYLGIRVGKNGIYKSDLARTKSREEFNLLTAYIEHILKATGEGIMSGNVAASPVKIKTKKAPCEFCLYGTVCGFDPLIEGYAYNELPKKTPEEMIDEMRRVTGIGLDSGTGTSDNDAR